MPQFQLLSMSVLHLNLCYYGCFLPKALLIKVFQCEIRQLPIPPKYSTLYSITVLYCFVGRRKCTCTVWKKRLKVQNWGTFDTNSHEICTSNFYYISGNRGLEWCFYDINNSCVSRVQLYSIDSTVGTSNANTGRRVLMCDFLKVDVMRIEETCAVWYIL